MKMKLNNCLIWTAIVVLTMSCSNNSTADLSDPNFVANPTYARNIKPVIDNNCIVCHQTPPQNGAPMSLDSYEQVKTKILEGKLLDRISRPQGAEGMMPNGGTRLPQATIDMFYRWKDQGFPQ